MTKNQIGIDKQLLSWSLTQNNIVALIQFGSRVQPDGRVDEWSDYDYHLICKSIKPFLSYDWTSVFTIPFWCIYLRKTIRGVYKATFLFEGGQQIELVFLTAWQMKIVYFLMRKVSWHAKLPGFILRGLSNTQIILQPGYVVLKGGEYWEKQVASVNAPIIAVPMTQADFEALQAGFWINSASILKYIHRGALRTAQHELFLSLRDTNRMLISSIHNLRDDLTTVQGKNNPALKITPAMTHDRNNLILALIAEINHFEELSPLFADKFNLIAKETPAKAWLIKHCQDLLVGNSNKNT